MCRKRLARGEAHSQNFDTIILGGLLLDGTGNPSFRADLGIKGDRIAAIGNLAGAKAGTRINATGRIVAPGFIDLHSHALDAVGDGSGPFDRRVLAAPNHVSQGITTAVINQDGRSPWPIRNQRDALERHGIGLNALLLVGHGALRTQVMGEDHRRTARPDEVSRMQNLVRDGMRDGAFGLSSGLEYIPGRWSDTAELIALTREIVPYRGIHISHQRSEGSDPLWYWPSQDPPGPPTAAEAVRETIEIGERTGATVIASHLKVKGAHLWGSAAELVELIQMARSGTMHSTAPS